MPYLARDGKVPLHFYGGNASFVQMARGLFSYIQERNTQDDLGGYSTNLCTWSIWISVLMGEEEQGSDEGESQGNNDMER